MEVWRRYNGRLGQTQRVELATLRWQLFSCAAVFSHRAGKPTLKLAVATEKHRHWWRVLLRQLSGEDDGYAVPLGPEKPHHSRLNCMSPAE